MGKRKKKKRSANDAAIPKTPIRLKPEPNTVVPDYDPGFELALAEWIKKRK